MKLYSYQENVLTAIRSDPSHSQLISMPTGTGKTITFLAAAKDQNKKCLILVHRQELLDQTYEKALFIGFKEKDVAVISSEEKQQIKQITIAMVPTLIRNLDLYKPEEIEMMIIDEAHHATAASYMTIMNHFKIFEEKKLLLGFTATPLRGDKKQLGNIFFSHSFKMTLSEATQNGYICPVHGMRVNIEKSLEEIDTVQGDYDITQLDKIMNCESVNNLVARRCSTLEKTPGLVFCTSINHAKEIASLLRKEKRKAISVSYLTPKTTLEKIYKKLRNGKIEFITNAIKLTEGFDYPPIQSIIICRPTRSPVLYKQMIGRGLRNSPNKFDCFVLEFTGNDKEMICWEDIDQNCTFQCSTLAQQKSREEALLFYKQRFTSPNIIILDVRVSPFNFYECRVQRIEKYKQFFYYCPIELGFCLFKLIPDPENRKYNLPYFALKGWFCFWKEKYKSFYVWSDGELSKNREGESVRVDYFQNVQYIKNTLKDLGYGKWYPSEEEPMSVQQKSFLKDSLKMSARKAEMFIEDCAVKQAIKRYFEKEEPESLKVESSHSTPLMQLSGKY